MVDSAERCFFVVKKVMFTVDEHKFAVHEHMYTDGKRKYTEREYKIDIVRVAITTMPPTPFIPNARLPVAFWKKNAGN